MEYKNNHDQEPENPGALPADLIAVLSRTFESMADVLSLALVCKRYHAIILSHIGDENNKKAQSLLALHLFKTIKLSVEWDGECDELLGIYASVASKLPNGTTHGKEQRWFLGNYVDLPVLIQLLTIGRASDKSSSEDDETKNQANYDYYYRNSGLPRWFDHNKTYTITRPEDVKEVERIIEEEDGQLSSEVWARFGKYEGKMTKYFTGNEIAEELPYHNGELHGEAVKYNSKGQITERSQWAFGKLHGPYHVYEYVRSGNNSAQKELLSIKIDTYNQGLQIQHEEYTRTSVPNQMVLHLRFYLIDYNRKHGPYEEFDTLHGSGIRTILTVYDNGSKQSHEEWDPITGVMTRGQYWERGILNSKRSWTK